MRFMVGIVSCPVVTTFEMTLPLSEPKNPLERIATLAGPPPRLGELRDPQTGGRRLRECCQLRVGNIGLTGRRILIHGGPLDPWLAVILAVFLRNMIWSFVKAWQIYRSPEASSSVVTNP